MPYTRSYGFQEPTIDPKDYHFGGVTKLSGEPLQPSGDWTDFLPEPEFQSRPYFDTNGCAIYGTLNALETLMKRVRGTEPNWSERFLAVVAQSDPTGNDPNRVIEAARTKGLVKETSLPFDDSITTWQAWASPKPMTQPLLDEAHRFLDGWQIGHEWVADDPAYIMEALKYSPLGVSVYAWTKNDQGLYWFPSGLPRNHWCLLVSYKQGEYWTIFDSYDQVLKNIAWDSKFVWIKRYYLSDSVRVSFLKQAIDLCVQILSSLKQTVFPPRIQFPPTPSPAPVEPPEPQPTTQKMSKLYTVAQSLIGTDASPKDLVKDGVGCAESVSTIIKKILPTFPVVTGTWSLWDALRASVYFQEVNDEPQPGDIILCATGTGSGHIPNGHVGIVGEGTGIMSNDSATGIWKVNFTRDSWKNYFVTKGSYPIHYFRLK